MAIIELRKIINEKDDVYNESDWEKRIHRVNASKYDFYESLSRWADEYIKKNFPQVGFKKYVMLKAKGLKQVIPCKRECPDVNVSQIIANFFSQHTEYPVPEIVSLSYVGVERGEGEITGSATKYLLKSSMNYDVYWLRKYYKVKKQDKKIKISLKMVGIKECIKNRELISLLLYKMFDANKSRYDDVIEFLKMTNPDGVVYYEFSLVNSIYDYELPANNTVIKYMEKKYILQVPDSLIAV